GRTLGPSAGCRPAGSRGILRDARRPEPGRCGKPQMSTQMTSRFSPRMRTAIAVLTLALLTGLVFIPGLGGDFVFDDFGNIVYNNRIHAETLTWEAVSRAAGAYQGPIGRPLATVSFAVDYALGGP